MILNNILFGVFRFLNMYFGIVKNSHLLYKIIDLALILDNALFFFLSLIKSTMLLVIPTFHRLWGRDWIPVVRFIHAEM